MKQKIKELKMVLRSGMKRSLSEASIGRELEKALLMDLAVLQARTGEKEWVVRNGTRDRWLFLKKELLLPLIDGEPTITILKRDEEARTAALIAAWNLLRPLPQDRLHSMREEIDSEFEGSKAQETRLLREYARSFAGGLDGVLVAIEKGVRERLESIIERRDKLAVRRDAVDNLIRWPTGPC